MLYLCHIWLYKRTQLHIDYSFLQDWGVQADCCYKLYVAKVSAKRAPWETDQLLTQGFCCLNLCLSYHKHTRDQILQSVCDSLGILVVGLQMNLEKDRER